MNLDEIVCLVIISNPNIIHLGTLYILIIAVTVIFFIDCCINIHTKMFSFKIWVNLKL